MNQACLAVHSGGGASGGDGLSSPLLAAPPVATRNGLAPPARIAAPTPVPHSLLQEGHSDSAILTHRLCNIAHKLTGVVEPDVIQGLLACPASGNRRSKTRPRATRFELIPTHPAAAWLPGICLRPAAPRSQRDLQPGLEL